MLGLSYRAVEKFLPCLECPTGKSSIERDVDEFGQKARQYHLSTPRMRIRILGVDSTGAALAGRDAGVLFFTDIQGQKLVLVEAIQETDSLKLRRHVAKVMAAVGADELRSDEHLVYRGIVSEDRHRRCLWSWGVWFVAIFTLAKGYYGRSISFFSMWSEPGIKLAMMGLIRLIMLRSS